MEMIDIDNPLAGYCNNDKRNKRISYTDNNINGKSIAIEESGLTLGLVLKEYCEFQVTNCYHI